MRIWSRNWFPTRNFFCEVSILPSQKNIACWPDGLWTANHECSEKIISWAKSDVTLVHLFKYNFEICFRESGFDLEIPTLRVKKWSEILLLQKMVLIELATKATRNEPNWKKVAYGKWEERYGTISEKRKAVQVLYNGAEFRPPKCGLHFDQYRFKCSAESFCIDEKPQGRLNLKKTQNFKDAVPL